MSLPKAFEHQARACEALDSPFMGQLMRLFADRLEPGTRIADRLLSWPGDISPSAQSVPLRIAGALHRLVLTGADAALAAAYPPNVADDDTLWAVVTAALDTHDSAIMAALDSPPQTNEVRRAACLIAAGHTLTDHLNLPIAISELGASAGLNLMWDHFALTIGAQSYGPTAPALTLTPDWRGDLPPKAQPTITGRHGVDLAPINPDDPDDALRLLSYLWPDQPHRLALTRAAINVASAPVDRADAVDWLPARLAAQQSGTLHLIYHTIAWQYLPAEARARGDALIAAAGARATADRPLARLGMEPDGNSPGAALTLTLWPDGRTHDLGRIDYHGRWVDWRAPVW